VSAANLVKGIIPEFCDDPNIGSTHLVGDCGRGPEGQLWPYCLRLTMPNAARSPWQSGHNAPEAPARHPRLELSTTVAPMPEIPG
jgi:hypothetical protein